MTTTNGFACLSPCALKMPRRSEFDVTISKSGYETARAHVTYGVAGAGGAAMAGNVFLGGIIGAGVDAGTGAMMDLKPNPLNVTLATLAFGPDGAPRLQSAPVLPAPAAPAEVAAAPMAPTRTAAPAPAQPGTEASVAAETSLPPVPTQTRKLPGHRVAGHGCPGFAPRVLYADNPDKLPNTCERMETL